VVKREVILYWRAFHWISEGCDTMALASIDGLDGLRPSAEADDTLQRRSQYSSHADPACAIGVMAHAGLFSVLGGICEGRCK
jgi:hypothetical protein